MLAAREKEEMDLKAFSGLRRSLTRDPDRRPQDYQRYNQVSLKRVLESVLQETNDPAMYQQMPPQNILEAV